MGRKCWMLSGVVQVRVGELTGRNMTTGRKSRQKMFDRAGESTSRYLKLTANEDDGRKTTRAGQMIGPDKFDKAEKSTAGT